MGGQKVFGGGSLKTILAIDPGANGGMAVVHNGNVNCYPMPDTEGDIIESFVIPSRMAYIAGQERVAYIEAQTGVVGPQMRVSASAMFTFGRNYGFLIGALQATGWKIELVRPQIWQKALSLGTKAGAGGKTAWKNKLKAEAQRLFPAQKVTLKTADALLLLEYAKRQQAKA